MTSEEKDTKDSVEFQLEDLLAGDSENLLAEILQLGLQQLMELERDARINVNSISSLLFGDKKVKQARED